MFIYVTLKDRYRESKYDHDGLFHFLQSSQAVNLMYIPTVEQSKFLVVTP